MIVSETSAAAGLLRDGRQAHWTDAIPAARRRAVRSWLYSVAAMTFSVIVVGGITRLTLSGLSIVEWKPLMGILPPLTAEQWQHTFQLYQQSPDYLWRQDMTLADFRFIYFWEYLHRLLARGIGLVFAVPFVVFWMRGWFTRPLLRRALLLFVLGAAQGLMGWLMVKSGLVDRPSVSHYRLAAHLGLAFTIFGWALWMARELTDRSTARMRYAERDALRRMLLATGALLAMQVVWGAFVAGLRAGRYYPTFPEMGGRLIPADLLLMENVLLNFVANPVAVQWTHRVLGTLLLLAAAALFLISRRAGSTSRRYATLFLSILGVQYLLGVATLLLLVPITLGVVHQAVAVVLFSVWLSWLHHVMQVRPRGAA